MCDRISTIMSFPEKEDVDPHIRYASNQLSVEQLTTRFKAPYENGNGTLKADEITRLIKSDEDEDQREENALSGVHFAASPG